MGLCLGRSWIWSEIFWNITGMGKYARLRRESCHQKYSTLGIWACGLFVHSSVTGCEEQGNVRTVGGGIVIMQGFSCFHSSRQ